MNLRKDKNLVFKRCRDCKCEFIVSKVELEVMYEELKYILDYCRIHREYLIARELYHAHSF